MDVKPGTIEICEVCGEQLDVDNCYGSEDMPLCRDHQGKFEDLLMFMVTGQLPLPEPK